MEKSRRNTKKRPAVRSFHWADIRRASKTLHAALIEAWSCTQAKHLRHSVKLFVEAQKSDDGVRMDIAIFGHGCDLAAGKLDMIRLQVRSTIMVISPTRLLLPSPGSGNECRPRKRAKTVRFDGDAPPTKLLEAHPPACPSSPDLRCSPDICLELTTSCGRKVTRTSTTCLGHLDVAAEDGYRHQFFPVSQSSGAQLGPWIMGTGELTPMDAILDDGSTSDFFLPVDRLKTAKALVLAVLKFHATPWLGDAWRLQDLAFFHYSQDLVRSLQTLHVGVEFEHLPTRNIAEIQPSPGSSQDQTSVVGPPTPISQVSEHERMFCGIANTTLYCLGVALLQIERSQSINLEDVVEVRKTAQSVASFGKDYKEIVEKCLWCDFGLGRDLAKPQLQQAVYASVVDGLEDLISKLDINDDDD